MEELYLNDILINLPLRSVSMNYQINDVGSIIDRQADYSNSIKIPRTAENIVAMEFLSVGGSTSRKPYEAVKVKYIVNGIEVISDGTGVITKTDKDFSLVIYDGNISMKDLLSDSTLQDLDWSSFAHTLTESSFFDSFANTSGYIYGVAKFINTRIGDTASIDATSPSFFIHTLFDMIFNSRGYIVSGDIFTDEDYLSRVVSMHRGYDRFATRTESTKRTFNAGTLPTFDISSGIHPTGYMEYEIDTYSAVTSVNHRITIFGNLDVEIGTDPVLIIKTDGDQIFVQNLESEDGILYPLDLDENISASAGQIISVVIGIIAEDVSGFKIKFDTPFVNTYYESDASISIDLATLIGETKQIDFVKTIMQHFNLLFRKKRNKSEFEFKKFNNILTDRANAEDWSDKYSRFIKESYKTKYAKDNSLKYKYDDDGTDVEQTWADGHMLLDNENLSAFKTIVTSLFKASPLESIFSVLRHWTIDEDDEDEEITSNEDGLRMFKVNRLNGALVYKMLFDSSGYSTFNGDYPLLDFSAIYYQKEYENNYLNFKELQEDYNKQTLELNLSIVDIYNLDFFKLKYFNQTGHYYYLNKVSGYKKNKQTKVDLVRIGNDVIEGLTLIGTSDGTSVVAGVLSKSAFGELTGESNGASVGLGILSKDTAVTITSFIMSTGSVNDPIDICTLTPSGTYYHDGAGGIPTTGDFIYTDESGTIPLNGQDKYRRLDAPYYLQIATDGEVLQDVFASCS